MNGRPGPSLTGQRPSAPPRTTGDIGAPGAYLTRSAHGKIRHTKTEPSNITFRDHGGRSRGPPRAQDGYSEGWRWPIGRSEALAAAMAAEARGDEPTT